MPATQPSLFCRRCDYALEGIARTTCPECGRAFDPADPRTFHRRSRAMRWRRRGKFAGCVIGAVLLALLALAGWEYRGVVGRQRVRAALPPGASISTSPVGPDWLRRYLPAGWCERFVQVDVTGCDDATLARLRGLRCDALRLFRSGVTDEGLAAVRDMRIRSLKLAGGSLAGPGLAHAAASPELVELQLHDSRLNDDSLRFLLGASRLETLDLSGCGSVRGPGLAHLAGCANLRQLRLYNTGVGDEAMEHVAKLTGLRELGLEHTRVTDAGLAKLAPLTGLRKLGLGGDRDNQITDASMPWIGRQQDLEELYLYLLPITDQGMMELRGLPRLRHVGLVGTRCGGEGLAALVASPIQNLHLDESQASNGIEHLRAMPRLRFVLVTGRFIDMNHVNELQKTFKAQLPNCEVGFIDP